MSFSTISKSRTNIFNNKSITLTDKFNTYNQIQLKDPKVRNPSQDITVTVIKVIIATIIATITILIVHIIKINPIIKHQKIQGKKLKN